MSVLFLLLVFFATSNAAEIYPKADIVIENLELKFPKTFPMGQAFDQAVQDAFGKDPQSTWIKGPESSNCYMKVREVFDNDQDERTSPPSYMSIYLFSGFSGFEGFGEITIPFRQNGPNLELIDPISACGATDSYQMEKTEYRTGGTSYKISCNEYFPIVSPWGKGELTLHVDKEGVVTGVNVTTVNGWYRASDINYDFYCPFHNKAELGN